jgi:hypothetical protein
MKHASAQVRPCEAHSAAQVREPSKGRHSLGA